MLIPMNIPAMFDAESSPAEKESCKAIVRRCVKSLSGNAKTKVSSLKRTEKTIVTFDLPNVFRADSNPLDNAYALEKLMRCLCSLNIDFLKRRIGYVHQLYNAGVIYDRTIVWDTIPALYSVKEIPGKNTRARIYGDCKSLTAALVAEYTVAGIPCRPVFRFMKPSKIRTNYHILVQTSQGFEDPSKVLGMGRDENSYFNKTG